MGIFGRKRTPEEENKVSDASPRSDLGVHAAREKPGIDNTTIDIITRYRESWTQMGISRSVEQYWALCESSEQSQKNADWKKAYADFQLALSLIEPCILKWRLEGVIYSRDARILELEQRGGICLDIRSVESYFDSDRGYFDAPLCKQYGRPIWGDDDIPELGEMPVNSILAINYLLRYDSVMGQAGGLKNLAGIIKYFPELNRLYADDVVKAEENLVLGKRIRKHLKGNPGTFQTALKKDLGLDDARSASTLCAAMEKFGLVRREPEGKTYKLFLTYGELEAD